VDDILEIIKKQRTGGLTKHSNSEVKRSRIFIETWVTG